MIDRKCFTCDTLIECDDRPQRLPTLCGWVMITPKFNAPLICKVCRADKKKFTKAQKAMRTYFNWAGGLIPHVPTKEL